MMGRLSFVGLGLGARGISVDGLLEIKEADVTYLEYYTTPHEPTLVRELESRSEKQMVLVDRNFVEDGRKILEEAKSSRVALAVPGDPMIATTHCELRVRAISQGIKTKVIHAATVGAAIASESGLHYYKFGRTLTITRESVERLSQAYQILQKNLLDGAHTLVLLEFDTEKGEGVTPSNAIKGLLNAETNFKRGVVSDGTFALVLCRVGRPDALCRSGTFLELAGMEFGGPPASIIVPGSLHFTETEAISAIFGAPMDKVHGNSDAVKRTAQILVPKYVEKTRRALESVRGELGKQYASVVENVELYMRDSENFLANGEDELAMLSIGYAEGLLDSLSFAGVVKIEW